MQLDSIHSNEARPLRHATVAESSGNENKKNWEEWSTSTRQGRPFQFEKPAHINIHKSIQTHTSYLAQLTDDVLLLHFVLCVFASLKTSALVAISRREFQPVWLFECSRFHPESLEASNSPSYPHRGTPGRVVRYMQGCVRSPTIYI